MRYIRWFLCALFALVAVIFARETASTLMDLKRVPEALLPLRPHSVAALALPALAMIYGMACWTFLRAKPAARGWGIAASTTFILLTALVEWADRHFGWAGGAGAHMATAGAGLVGVIAFSRSDVVAAETTSKPEPGDGTSAWINRMMWLVAAAGYLAVTDGWSRWAELHGLERAPWFTDLGELIAVALVVLAIHESGHALAGLAMRMRVCTFGVGPMLWSRWSGRWKLSISRGNLLRLIGMTHAVPTRLKTFRRDKIVQVAGGPVATLLSGGAALALLLTAPNHVWAHEWNFLKLLVTLSLIAGPLNLIPFRIGAGHSDGAKLYQLIRNGLWADYWLADSAWYASWATLIRARDYDVEATLRAAGTIAKGAEETQFLLLAVSHYYDLGRMDEAREALTKAEASARETEAQLSADVLAALIFYQAVLVGDDVAAWERWDRAIEKQPSVAEGVGSGSLCALLIAEEQWAEAEEALANAEAWAWKLAWCGAGDMERDVVRTLRLRLDEGKAAAAAQARQQVIKAAKAEMAAELVSKVEEAKAAVAAAELLSRAQSEKVAADAEFPRRWQEHAEVEAPAQRRWHDDAALLMR